MFRLDRGVLGSEGTEGSGNESGSGRTVPGVRATRSEEELSEAAQRDGWPGTTSRFHRGVDSAVERVRRVRVGGEWYTRAVDTDREGEPPHPFVSGGTGQKGAGG